MIKLRINSEMKFIINITISHLFPNWDLGHPLHPQKVNYPCRWGRWRTSTVYLQGINNIYIYKYIYIYIHTYIYIYLHGVRNRLLPSICSIHPPDTIQPSLTLGRNSARHDLLTSAYQVDNHQHQPARTSRTVPSTRESVVISHQIR